MKIYMQAMRIGALAALLGTAACGGSNKNEANEVRENSATTGGETWRQNEKAGESAGETMREGWEDTKDAARDVGDATNNRVPPEQR